MGWRETPTAPYQWLTYGEVYDRVCMLGSGLRTFRPANVDIFCIGVYAVNCVEWAVTQQACSTFGYVIVPLYDTLGDEARKYIIGQTELSVCICDSPTRVRNLLSDLTDAPCLKTIVLTKASEEDLATLRSEAADRVQLLLFKDILDLGTANAQPEKLPEPDDLHLLCYTSGTTGRPKGVMITHKMIVAVIGGFDMDLQEVSIKPNALLQRYSVIRLDCAECLDTREAHLRTLLPLLASLNIIPGDVYLSFLPLAHVFEQIVMHYCLGRGAAYGFYSGDLRNLSNDILALRPTLFCAVPRVLQRLYGTVQSAVAGSKFKTWLLKIAVEAKMRYVRQGIVTRDTIWDKYVLKPIQDRMGGRLRFFACGSAPMSEEVYQFCRAALGVHAYEAYGLTETCGATIMTLPGDYICGHVGAPLPCSKIKLVDVPDMDLFVERDHVGEICVKGNNVTAGYYKDPERTREVIDEDGWLHTGDIGRWTERGCIQIADRCKNMFKLSQGEYVSPEKVEMIYGQSGLVNQVFVDGDSQQAFAIAIVVPQFDALRAALKTRNYPLGILNGSAKNSTSAGATETKASSQSDEELCKMREARLVVLSDLIQRGKEAGLKGFEQAKSICLISNEFTIESGLLTPTQKKCRVAFRRLFKNQIDQLYSGGMLV
ncbi:unnamed protein product [Schistocephalus solidus]|uniref:long-chain-fatty-acid--CoA ligase n=1 Tax=Schistocephalus solidus TaxID=70667 RepID=A0A3P7EG17_SCHSO|nr:unnamed protein product [Schistocephalus solidus]